MPLKQRWQMLDTVYIETTIPSYYYETRRSPTAIAWREATRNWWHRYSTRYELLSSGYVYLELDKAPPAKARRALGLLSGIPTLDEPPG